MGVGLRSMELKDVILESVNVLEADGKNVIEEYVDYNLTKRIAEIEVVGGDKDIEEESESRFLTDTRLIVRLAKEAIPVLEDKIKNNKTVMLYSTHDEVEMTKCKRHLANNENRLKVVKEFILENITL
jgi:hypothetical protein